MKTARLLSPIALVAVFLAALLAGCGGGGGSSSGLKGDDVALVGSAHVTKSAFDTLLAQAKLSYKQQGKTFPKQGTTEYETVKGQAVALLVQQAERTEKAKSEGINVTDSQVEKRLNQIKKQYFRNSEAKYKAQLKKQNLTDARSSSPRRSSPR
jgi:SurA-like N-terminal domain